MAIGNETPEESVTGVGRVVEVEGSTFVAKFLNESGTYTFYRCNCDDFKVVV